MKINGEAHYLWRGVDHEGDVLESFVTKRRDRKAVKWSGKFGQRAKMYPTRMNGYENDEATEFFG